MKTVKMVYIVWTGDIGGVSPDSIGHWRGEEWYEHIACKSFYMCESDETI